MTTQNSKMTTQNSKMTTQNSKMTTQNSKMTTQNSKMTTLLFLNIFIKIKFKDHNALLKSLNTKNIFQS